MALDLGNERLWHAGGVNDDGRRLVCTGRRGLHDVRGLSSLAPPATSSHQTVVGNRVLVAAQRSDCCRHALRTSVYRLLLVTHLYTPEAKPEMWLGEVQILVGRYDWLISAFKHLKF